MNYPYSVFSSLHVIVRRRDKVMYYGYGGYGYGGGGCGGGGYAGGFALIVVLFILLIIVGTAFIGY
jgi:uncharacterized protein (TIGR01732 family)